PHPARRNRALVLGRFADADRDAGWFPPSEEEPMAAKTISNTRLKAKALDPALSRFVRAQLEKTGTPGVAVGVLHKGRAQAGGFGVTSLNGPAPVDAETLFQIGSTTKTFTATAVMRLVE